MRSLLKPVVVVISLVVIVATALYPASAQPERPVRPWPGPELRVDNRAGFFIGAGPAVREINRTGIGIRLRLTRSRPDVVIRLVSPRRIQELCGPDCVGSASFVGYRGRREIVSIDRSFARRMPTQDLVTHELGHILGLGHVTRGCGLMYPGDTKRHCPAVGGHVRCGFSARELNTLSRLYGRQGVYSPWCPLAGEERRSQPSLILPGGQELFFRRGRT